MKRLSQSRIPSDIEKLIENIKPFFVRVKKSDLNLPPVSDHPIVSNDLSDIESNVYDRLENQLVNSDAISGNAQSIHFRMIQTCNNLNLLNNALGVNYEDSDFGIYNDSLSLEEVLGESLSSQVKNLDQSYIPTKHKIVQRLVSDLEKRNEKVILWGVYIDSIKRLHKYLQASGLKGAYVIGETKKGKVGITDKDESTRENIIELFKTSDLDYIISNPVVLGESISLHKVCHTAIYYETNYYHILTSKRTDTDIHHRVQAKFNRMLEIIEHDIPFFQDDLESERNILIQNIIDDYRAR